LTGDFSLLKLNGQIARQLEDSNEAGEEFYRALSESGLFVIDTASRIHKTIHFNNFSDLMSVFFYFSKSGRYFVLRSLSDRAPVQDSQTIKKISAASYKPKLVQLNKIRRLF
jgi:hypothetical protein